MLVEDSLTARTFLTELIAAEPDMELVGIAEQGEAGVAAAEEKRPDVILMDANMPVMDGFRATRLIMERCPTRIIIFTASYEPSDLRTSMLSLEAGALAIVSKPWGPDHSDYRNSTLRVLETIRTMSEVQVVRRWPPAERPAAAPVIAPLRRNYRMVVMGASTGGPRVLAEILRNLSPRLPTPVCVVQHISPGFVQALVDWLNAECPHTVALARSGQRARPGHVYFAPDDMQLGFAASGDLSLTSDPPENGFRPSISRLFSSAAAVWGDTAIGVLLSGMGQDGAEGCRRLSKAGAPILVQDPASCVVASMPLAAIASSSTSRVLQPALIAAELNGLIGVEGSHAI
ncbi:chemotaxis protein CheB [Ancylobacter pratisalsi]|uniref:protein-glutamate methylesterase n=1 Tax=Ancylobacter pratisalsi TaxID=1745854 RepID=A0A6P1YNR5_9HYPH|nr:chemotaxis protein CheB [Ancylobacter pratisalsi]QIB34540.1 response regulator [Ancylobacter pratisalsi]